MVSHAVKQKLRDAYITNWHAQLDESSGNTTYKIRVAGWGYGPRLLGPKEIDGLLASPGKASTLLCTDSPSAVNSSSLSLPRKSGSSNHP